MSTKEKQLQKFRSVPKDFTWDELVSVLNGLGFLYKTNSGSRRVFWNKENTNQTLFLHEPHPSNIVKACYIRKIIDKLQEWELLP